MSEHTTIVEKPTPRPRYRTCHFEVQPSRIVIDLWNVTLLLWKRRSQWMWFWGAKKRYRLWVQLGPVEIFWR